MKAIFNYVVGSMLLLIAVVLILSGGFYSLAGLVWCGFLVVSGDAFPSFWRRFWRSNMRILKYFDCL